MLSAYRIQAVGLHLVQDVQRLEKNTEKGGEPGPRTLLPYKERLQKLDLLIIKDRALHGDLIKAYKILTLTGKVNIDPGTGQFFVLPRRFKN